MHHRALRRALPFAAMLLGCGAIVVSTAHAAAGVIVPAVDVDYNTGSVALTGFPAGSAETITVTRDGVNIATATGTTTAAGGLSLNVPHILPPEVLACWTGFTPDILPGDTVTVTDATAGTNSIVMPNFSVGRPSAVGADLVLHGTAADPITGAPLPAVDGVLYSKLSRFTVGTHGKAELSIALATGFAGFISYDAPGSTAWTGTFSGLTPVDFTLGLGAVAKAATVVAAGTGAPVVPITMRALFDNPGVAGPVAGCTAPLGSDAVTGSSIQTINAANANQAVTITGSADPNVKSVVLILGGVAAPAVGTTAWTATVPASSLPEGNLLATAAYTSAAGTYHGKTMNIVKDTVAPNAPTASVPAGTYSSAQNVELSSNDPSATIHYTTDGTDPNAGSPTCQGAVSVAGSGTIKAIAIDAAGNGSPISAFGYTINQPGAPKVAPPVVVPAPQAPPMKADALTLSHQVSLRSARQQGLHAVIFAPTGAKVVRIKVVRNGRVIDTVMRRVTGHGVVSVVMPHSSSARHHLKRGTYQVLVTPGASASQLGATTTRTVRIR